MAKRARKKIAPMSTMHQCYTFSVTDHNFWHILLSVVLATLGLWSIVYGVLLQANSSLLSLLYYFVGFLLIVGAKWSKHARN